MNKRRTRKDSLAEKVIADQGSKLVVDVQLPPGQHQWWCAFGEDGRTTCCCGAKK